MFNPSDFHRIKDDQEKAVSEVNHYLQEEEKWLLDSILQAFHINLEEEAVSEDSSSRFSEVIDAVVERIDQIASEKLSKLSPKEFDVVIAHINAAFRHYEEILEGCAAQLFHELEKIRVDELEEDTLKGVEAVKVRLLDQIDSCVSQIRRLEKKLSECAGGVQSKWSFVASVSRFFRSILDKSIIAKLKKIKQMVVQGYMQLCKRHNEYRKLNETASTRLAKLENFVIFHRLPAEVQQEFTEIYRLIKIRQLNAKSSDLLGLELDRVLKDTVSVDRATDIFEAYFGAIENEIYTMRREMTHMSAEELQEGDRRKELLKSIKSARREVHVLGSLVLKFRDFVLATHPDPYVRARLGFSERTVGPEPKETKSLMQLGLKVETLDKRYERLAEAIEEFEPQQRRAAELGYFDEIIGDLERLSWEAKAAEEATLYYQTFLSELQEVQDRYSFDRYRLMGIEKVLRLALRLDHFHVLIDERRFQDIYDTHIKIRGPVPNVEQRKRLKALNKLNFELQSLRTSTASLSQSARSIAKNKADAWREEADALLADLEAFIGAMRQRIPIPLPELMETVAQRRYEVLEFLFAYHTLASRLRATDLAVPEELKQLMDRVHKIEGDFAYLSSHHERVKGPMDMVSLRALESL